MARPRRAIGSLFALAGFLATDGAASADDTADCISVSEEAQSLAAHHRLIAARRAFGDCLRDACPAPILRDCAEQLERVEGALPSVVLVAVSSRGRDLHDIRVAVDGVPTVDALDGTAIAVDPGPHRWVFTAANGATETVDQVIEEGAKRKRVVATFVVPRRREPVPASAWIAGGVAVASLGLGSALGAETLADRGALYTPSERDSFLVKQHVIDVAFGVGIASLAVAAWLVLTRPDAADAGGVARRIRARTLDLVF